MVKDTAWIATSKVEVLGQSLRKRDVVLRWNNFTGEERGLGEVCENIIQGQGVKAWQNKIACG